MSDDDLMVEISITMNRSGVISLRFGGSPEVAPKAFYTLAIGMLQVASHDCLAKFNTEPK